MNNLNKLVLNFKLIIYGGIIILLFNSCGAGKVDPQNDTIDIYRNESLFRNTLLKHLDAISNRDLNALSLTLSPNGNMQLILPNSEILYTTEKFLEYHKEWFKDPNWSFESKILNTKIEKKLGIATVEIIYKEPERNGKPYSNRMIVSYALEKLGGNWYIIKDQASSVEKTEN